MESFGTWHWDDLVQQSYLILAHEIQELWGHCITKVTKSGRGLVLKFDILQAQYQQEDDYVYNEKLTWEKVGVVASTFSNWCVVMQGLPGSLPWGVLLTFLNDYLAHDQHLTTERATSVSFLSIQLLLCSCVPDGACTWVYSSQDSTGELSWNPCHFKP